jgi:peptidoglycan/xylan/chitin deacetylase (PgdA/CDA1 family)
MSLCMDEFAIDRPPRDAAMRVASHDGAASRPVHHEQTLERTLIRRVSGRLASHVPLDVRRLDNPAPMVSFTFDDVPDSAYSRGAPMLERQGGRGVYYVSTALIGRRTVNWTLIDRDEIADLHERGHEIALHTHEHRAVGSYSVRELRADLDKNRAELRRIHPGIDPQNFAYPYGMAAFARKLQLSSLVRSSRGVKPGINAGAFDAQFIKCVELADAQLTPERLCFYLDAVVAQKGWLVFLTHDISAAPSRYGCSIGLFQRAVDEVAARGVKVATVADALRQSRPAGPAERLAALRPQFAK